MSTDFIKEAKQAIDQPAYLFFEELHVPLMLEIIDRLDTLIALEEKRQTGQMRH